MKILRIHLVEIVAAILFIILVLFLYRDNRELLDTTGDMSYSKYWTYVTEEGTREYQMLPESIKAAGKRGEIVLRKQLPEDIASINSICFYTSHQLVEVYVGQDLVYERKVLAGVKSRTPGNCWNFVQLWEGYAGQILEVHIRNCYESDHVKVPEFLYGSSATVILEQIKGRFLSLIICFSYLPWVWCWWQAGLLWERKCIFIKGFSGLDFLQFISQYGQPLRQRFRSLYLAGNCCVIILL